MSANFVKKLLNAEIAHIYKSTFRKELEKDIAQALIIRDVAGFDKVFKSFGIYLAATDLLQIQQAGVILARKLNNDYRKTDPALYNSSINNLVKANIITRNEIGNTVFIIKGWDKLTRVKVRMMSKAAELNSDIEANKTLIGGEVHRAHGESGLAVSQVDIARGFRFLAKAVGVKQLETLMGQALAEKTYDVEASRLDEINKIHTKYKQIVTPSQKLVANYVSVITFQMGKENIGESAEEKALKALFYRKIVPNVLGKIIEIRNSSSIKDKIFTSLLKFATNIKGAVVKLDPKYRQPLKSEGKAESTYKTTKHNIYDRPVERASFKVPRAEKSRVNLNVLVPQINARLSEQIAMNMGSPRLNYRTGRFAESARVLNIMDTPQGMPIIDYTYMRNPYGVFEHPPHTTEFDRDPRKIIGQSIREIAVGIMQSKFTTRRV